MLTRRQALHSVGLFAGAGLAHRLVPELLLADGVRQAEDALGQMRAQMGQVPIQRTALGRNLSLLSGPGGNVVALTGPEGIVLVDSFVQPAWPALQKEIAALGGKVTLLVDTHWHFDHTDNNANLRGAGAEILAHEKTKVRLAEPHDLLGMHIPAAPTEALPNRTLGNTWGQHVNGESMVMTAFAPAHTDTDISVYYEKANVLHMGDVFFNGLYPFIDASTGGNIDGMIAGAAAGLKRANARTKIVPGHGPLGDKPALTKYHDMLVTVRDRVAKLKKAGKSLTETQAEKPTKDLDPIWGKNAMLSGDDFVAMIYGMVK